MSKKSPYWSKKGKPGPWDYIVIGSGMGGMTTAAALATLGKRVLVLEQHYVPGGFTHTFDRKNYSWDVGVHAVGEVTERSMPGRLLKKLTGGRLEWASLGEIYEQFYFPDDFRIDFPDNPHQFRDNLASAFPNETTAIDAYLNEVREVSSGMKGYYLARAMPKRLGGLADQLLARKAKAHLRRRTLDVVNGLTQDEKLRTLFCAQWGYYGSPPSRSSFAIQALVVKHFQWGGYYPVGGSGRIADTMLRTVAEAGGWTRIRADVDRIIIENGAAVGVALKDGEEIRAPRVISAAGIQSTIRRLLPQELTEQAWAQSVTALPPAPAHVCLYLGFKGDIRKVGCSGANKWFCGTWDAEASDWDISDPDNIPRAPVLYTSFPSLKDPEHDPGPEVRHTGEVVTFVPWEAFQPWVGSRWKKRGEGYDSFKTKLKAAMLEQFFEHIPELKPMLDFAELSTPLSTDNFCRPTTGSIYGIEPTPERFENPWLRARSPVKNLFFSGSEVASVGVIGAMMGGFLGAASAEPRGVFDLMRNLGK